MINWAYFPQSNQIPPPLRTVVDAFIAHSQDIDSDLCTLSSTTVQRFIEQYT
ncbi:hypothetical protein GCM10027181_08650 [Rheinheimera gaetbuli]